MLTFEDCLAFSGLDESEVRAIAEHENIPQMAALEVGTSLMNRPGGETLIERMIVEDLERARRRGNVSRVVELQGVLARFRQQHCA